MLLCCTCDICQDKNKKTHPELYVVLIIWFIAVDDYDSNEKNN